MRNILLAATVAVATALPAAASAQGTQAVGYREAEDDRAIVQPFNRTVDEIEDMNVFGTGGEKIGEVDEVLVDSAGSIVAVAVESGGFLGIGDEEVVVMLDQLTLEGDRFSTGLTKDQLLALPRWKD
ncbi:sporulation protein YlmC with PRC-barrel domain [Constrictibacter sp. MBR-5]|jgi:sporulation protein YlmC with PRC-barrel domain|uniref:PRC-barrel domain-containing protein n=1 Tax=Constrictibacter sp. MBR-5 TaxID=3156467 RepID=UPI00339B49F1